MRIEAPYPEIDAVIILPNPLLRNKINLNDTREYRVMMDKSVHSYVRRTPSFLYSYQFYLSREKSEEMLEFLQIYGSQMWRWQDHHGVYETGYCLNNPQDTVVNFGPFLICGSAGFSRNEQISFTLELES